MTPVRLGPLAPAIRRAEAWQADARHLADPSWRDADHDFLDLGRAWTDADGCYEFLTLMPGAFDEPAGLRAPHVNLSVLGSGIMRRLLTIVFFAGHSGNERDPVFACAPEPALRSRLEARSNGEQDGMSRYRFDIFLRGSEETPFFDD